MDVSSRGLPPLLMDLSKGFSVGRLTRSHRPQPQALDMTKKPEWYHRQPQNCSADLPSPYRTSSLHPDLNQDPGSFMSSPLTPGLDLYHDQVRSNLWHSGFYEQSGDAGPESSGGEEEEEEEEEEEDSDSDSDVIFLVSSAKEPLLCTSFIQDNVTHIVEPLSPAVSSLEEGPGFYHLPQTVSSPSRDSSYTEDSSDSSMDIPLNHARPVVLLSDLSAVYAHQLPAEASSDDSDVIEVSISQSKNKLCKKSKEREVATKPKVRQSSRRRSCNTPPLTPRRNLRRQVKISSVGLYNESYDSDDVLDFMARSSSSDESLPPPKKSQRMSSKVSNSSSNRDLTTRDKSPSKSPEREEPPQCKTICTKYNGNKRKSTPTIANAKKLQAAKQNGIQSKGKEASVKVKTVTKRRKRKRKFNQSGPPSLFPPIEPELALKYAYRKKRERKFDSFSPFVHMEKRACTVVNYHEEEKAQSRPATCQDVTGFVPTTSCYNPGRVSSEFKCDGCLKCCLCGQTANAKSLGDLHGPYLLAFSEGPDSRTILNGHLENHTVEDGNKLQNKSPKEDGALENGTLNLEECWVHEDCGVWSTGVFLVRGKLYGLKEAALLAQQTMCWCCGDAGAIMGCFQKGCSRNFHFSCAVQSGCVLNEDNFSMRCPDHKNKPCVSRPHLR